MRKVLVAFGMMVVCGVLALMYLKYVVSAEEYVILQADYVVVTNMGLPKHEAVICYSNDQLRKAGAITNVLHEAHIQFADLDKPDRLACIVPNYTVDRVVGRQDIGFIILRTNPVPGISYTLLKGTKRFLQLNSLKQNLRSPAN